ncbi:hypothetical protein [Cyanobium sp. ATX 6F1]|nr:hypothetical protein [Cyanobium sp. ATX 6F1]MCP9915357.1 hypothetical protein [Cyanobium sp. ATX 6F1]
MLALDRIQKAPPPPRRASTKGRGPLQWHLENVEATITGWSRRNLQL